MAIKKVIIKKLLKYPRGLLADHLNNKIKGFSWGEIQDGLRELLQEGVIAVSNKRFWILSSERAMFIRNAA
jgi:hypothetical protein